MMKEYEITFECLDYITHLTEQEKVTVIATSLSNALDLFNSYARDIKKLEILNIKFIRNLKNCLIEKVGD